MCISFKVLYLEHKVIYSFMRDLLKCIPFMLFSFSYVQNAHSQDNATAHPLMIGQKYEADFGGNIDFELNFVNDSTLTFTRLKGEQVRPVTVKVKITEIGPKLYMVLWQERDKTTVTDIEDYEHGIVYSNITSADKTFWNLKGTLKKK